MIKAGENSPWGRIPGLVEDHVELLDLEYRYENEAGRQRLASWALAALCFVSSFILIQAAVIYALWSAWGSFYALSLGFASAWGAVGAAIYLKWGRRNPTVGGGPFQGTRDEFRRTLQWMHKHLS